MRKGGLLSKMDSKLLLKIHSFSFKQGIPEDQTHHGGGFVFDCRCLPNPGKEDRFRDMSGLNSEVSDYLKSFPEVRTFFDLIKKIIKQAISNYQKRDFDYLSVSFGCTGGRHRSVYCAERLARELRAEDGLEVQVEHGAKDSWGRA